MKDKDDLDLVLLADGRTVSRLRADFEKAFNFPAAPTTQTPPSPTTTVEDTQANTPATAEERRARRRREYLQSKEDERLAQAGFKPGERPTPAAEEDARALFSANGVGNAAVLNKLALADKRRYLDAVAAGRFLGITKF